MVQQQTICRCCPSDREKFYQLLHHLQFESNENAEGNHFFRLTQSKNFPTQIGKTLTGTKTKFQPLMMPIETSTSSRHFNAKTRQAPVDKRPELVKMLNLTSRSWKTNLTHKKGKERHKNKLRGKRLSDFQFKRKT